MSDRNKKFSRLIDEDDAVKEEYASCIEEFIAKYLAVEVLSNQGRVFIFLLWAVLIAFSLIGAVQMEMNFSMEFFLIPD